MALGSVEEVALLSFAPCAVWVYVFALAGMCDGARWCSLWGVCRGWLLWSGFRVTPVVFSETDVLCCAVGQPVVLCGAPSKDTGCGLRRYAVGVSVIICSMRYRMSASPRKTAIVDITGGYCSKQTRRDRAERDQCSAQSGQL